MEDWVDRLSDELGERRLDPKEVGAILKLARACLALVRQQSDSSSPRPESAAPNASADSQAARPEPGLVSLQACSTNRPDVSMVDRPLDSLSEAKFSVSRPRSV